MTTNFESGISFFGAPIGLPERQPPTPSDLPISEPEPEPPQKQPRRGGGWLVLVLGIAVGAGLWMLTQSQSVSNAPAVVSARTATAASGSLAHTLRVGGTIQARNFAAIRAPRMSGPGDTGRRQLTLMTLAAPGSIVQAGAEVAQFELKWLEDHIDDRESAMVQARAVADRGRAQILLQKENSRQAALAAKAAFEKAKLDLRTAEVKSEIQAEILKNLSQEGEATWGQLEAEKTLKTDVHAAMIRQDELTIQENQLHLDRHIRDLEKMTIQTPVGGLVVMEPMYKDGSVQQTAEGDQIYPGSLIMRVVDLSEMIVSASVNQVDIQAIRIGQKTEVRLDAYPEIVLEGKVSAIGAIAEAGSGGGRFSRGSSGLFLKSVPVEIEIEATDERVIPDLSASGDILIGETTDGILIPREAVRDQADKTVVYVRAGQGFEPRSVQLGAGNDTHVIVESGISEGDEVLLSEIPKVS